MIHLPATLIIWLYIGNGHITERGVGGESIVIKNIYFFYFYQSTRFSNPSSKNY